MRRLSPAVPGLAALAVMVACSGQPVDTSNDSHEAPVESNGLLAKWTGPFGGVPAFDKMDLAALEPALEAGMAKHIEELDAIAANSESATFDNTIAAMERSGRDIGRVVSYWGIWSSNVSTEEFRAIQTEMAMTSAV